MPQILLRRGTDAQRLGIVLAEGEPYRTTDTKLLYVGDGTTAGGVLVGDPAHNHDSDYADISHNHDSDYSDIDHDHSWSEITGKPSKFDPSPHSHAYLPLSGGTMTGNFTMGSGTKINLGGAAYSYIGANTVHSPLISSSGSMFFKANNDNGGTAGFVQISAGSDDVGLQVSTVEASYQGNRLFDEGYHPNADKWTTARINTVVLSGDVTGTGSASVDGSGNWTVAIATDLNVASTDTFTGTYPIAWLATDNLYKSTWLTINGANDTLNTRNINANGTVTATSFSGSLNYNDITNPPVIDNSVDYINAASFNTGNGVLTLSGVGRAGATVDLDNRYELAHSHPYLSNATDSEQTAHFGTVFWNQGASRVNSDPRINEGNYDADLTNIHWWATTASGANYGRVGHALYNGSAYQYLHTKASQNALYHNNNVIWTAGNFNPNNYLLASNYVDNYADSVSFNTSNGILTIGRTGSLADLTVDLDGRYLTSETDSQTLSWNGSTGQLSISNGNTVDLDDRYLTAGSSYDLTGDIRVTSGSLSFYGDTHMGFIPYPNGGQFRSDSGSLTGYIKISLPDGVDNSDDMISFWVDIFDYTTSESVSLFIGGYNYQSTGNYWVNCTAQVFTKSASKDYTVRFGFDGSRKFVTIGETTSTWSHPSVVVRDFQTSFRGNVTQYRDDWAITTSTSAFSGVDETQIGNLPQSSSAKKWTTARTITLAGDASGSVSIDGASNRTLTVSVANDSHTHQQVYIPDTRGAARAPSYYPDRYVSFDFQNNSDTAAGGDSWHVLQTIAPWSAYDNSHRQQQLAFTGTGGVKFRYATSDSAWAGWQRMWTSGNDGSGSGLDADLLDGSQASAFGKLANTQTWAGTNTFSAIVKAKGYELENGQNISWGGKYAANIPTIAASTNFITFYPSGTTHGQVLKLTGAELTMLGNKVYHAGNDGAGSGLDADLLDGLHASSFARTTGTYSIRATGTTQADVGLSNVPNWSSGTFDGRYLGKTANAVSASKWTTAKTLSLTGDVTGSVLWDGSANVTLSAQVSNNSHSHNYIFSDVQSSAPSNALQYLNTQGNSNDSPTNDWYNTIRMGHGDPNTYYNNTLAVKMTGSGVGGLWGRTTSNGTKGTWRRFFADDYHPNADKWTTARTITLNGDASGSVSIDGSANKTLTVAVANDSHSHTTLASKGRLDGSVGREVKGHLSHFSTYGKANKPTGMTYPYNLQVTNGSEGFEIAADWNATAASNIGFRVLRDCCQDWSSWSRIFNDNYHPNADRWTTARTISLSGDASGSVSIDGSSNRTLSVTVKDNSHSHSNYLAKTPLGSFVPDGQAFGSNDSFPNRPAAGFYKRSYTGYSGSMFVMSNVSGSTASVALEFAYNGKFKFHANTDSNRWDSFDVWTSGNDGAGSGLDADLLDGQQPSKTGGANRIAQYNTNGYLYVENWIHLANNTGLFYDNGTHFRSTAAGTMELSDSGSNNHIDIDANANYWKYLRLKNGTSVKWDIATKEDDTSGALQFRPAGGAGNTAYVTTNGYYVSDNQGTLWGGSNDGSGSGLDADLLDGLHASAFASVSHSHSNYLTTTGKAADANKLDGIDSGSFLRSDATDYLNGVIYVRADIRNETDYRDHGVYGHYDSYKTNHIWSMGSSYRNSSSGANFGNLYGFAYKHTNNGTGGTMGGGHMAVWCQNGTPYVSMGSNLWAKNNITAYSDARVKTNLEPIPNALEKVTQLTGYTYNRTDLEPEENDVRHAGVIAQEVLEVLPEVVTGGPTDNDPDNHYSVAYGNMVALLIEAIKEQQTQINELKARLN